MGKNIKYILIALVSLVSSACTSGVEYVNNSTYTALTGDQVNRNADFDTKVHGPKQYGALIFKKDRKKEISDKENVVTFALKRQKQRFFAETTLFDSNNNEKTFVDRTFFDFGVDKSSKGVSLGLTMQF